MVLYPLVLSTSWCLQRILLSLTADWLTIDGRTLKAKENKDSEERIGELKMV